MRMYYFLCGVALWFSIGYSTTYSANTITVQLADKVYTYALSRNSTLFSIITTAPAHIIVANADIQYIPTLRLAPADLRTIYTALQARIFVDHADRQFTPILIKAPTALQSIYSTLLARIFVDHADAQFVPVLVPIILDNGVPTGTVARNVTIGTPTSTIQSRRQVTATPTTMPTDMPQPATAVADEIMPSSAVMTESTPAPSVTPIVIP